MGLTPKLVVSEVADRTLSDVPLELPPNVVQVWKQLLAPAGTVETCLELLPTDERERAARYRLGGPRNDFIVTRGTLRFLIARYLRRAPQELTFTYTQFGKPLLKGQSDLCFNVSHTDGLALLAFVRRREIGVDVEKIRPETDVRQLASRFFSARERHDLEHLRGDELQAAFFRCWTRKEAYIKAKGSGLSIPLDEFDVSVNASESQVLLATGLDPTEASRWILRDVPVTPGYAAALAVSKDMEN
jgi:4'-phosphopantetheinyl transferase